MTTLQPPELSVILTTDSLATVEKILACLRAQSRADRVELLFVAPANAEPGGDDAHCSGVRGRCAWSRWRTWRLSRSQGRGESGRPARPSFCSGGGTRASPTASYLEALIDAHARPWAAVGPSVRNANPGSTISWACLLLDYGRWVELAKSGPIPDVPGYSSAYKRALLLRHGGRGRAAHELEQLSSAPTATQGHDYLEGSMTRVNHLNVSRFRWAAVEHFESGRAFAATRALGWSPPRRLVYAAA